MDRDTYLIHHFEGEPAKSPSGWIKDLKLSSNYSDVGGMWLVSWSQGTADVRLFGPHTMRERTLSYQALRRVSDSPSNRDGAFPTPLLAGRGSHGWNQHHWRTVSDSRSREL